MRCEKLDALKEELKILYIDTKLTAKEIAKIYETDVYKIKYYIRKFSLTNNKYKIDYKLSSLQKDVIVGSALGDGYLDCRNDSSSLSINHAENQRKYCQMKFDILKDICNHEELRLRDRSNDHDAKKRQQQYGFNTKYLTCLTSYYKMNICELLDALNENSLTIWLLDDGHKYEPRGKNKNSSYELSIGRFSEKEVKYSQEIIKKKFNLVTGVKYNAKWKNAQYTLTFDVEQSYLLSELIRHSEFGYIAEESMKYKLIEAIHLNRITKNYDIVRNGFARTTA